MSHNPSSLQMPVVDMKRGYSQTDMVAAVVAPWPALLGYSILFANSVRKLFRKNVV